MAETSDPIVTATEAPAKVSLADRLGDPLQNGIKVLIGANRKPPRTFKTLLNGTWFGHPIHPVITDIPIGAWLLAALFDILWLAAPTGNAWAARGAQALVLVGVITALGAAATGATDWSDTYGSERAVGLLHGSLMSLAAVLYIISMILRFTTSTGDSAAAAIIGFLGIITVLVGAYYGGDMVFGKGTGVNHTAWEAGGEDFEAVATVADVQQRALTKVMVAGVPVLLVRMGERYYAISSTCGHAGGPLDEGELQGDVVQCPWHGSRFRLRDGKPVTGPATMAQPRYDVRVRDGQIELKRAG
ncbi:MAG TPA: Rieske 2Fe-2S domain-containing protein [Ktedonobacterales bacterium]|nr:Rieske 2Fe-2S domain-containing protein [Ktedonobacterales bacterium]